MTFVEVKFECINWWGNEVYRTKNGTFSYKDYIGEYFDVLIGEPFYYETYDIVSKRRK